MLDGFQRIEFFLYEIEQSIFILVYFIFNIMLVKKILMSKLINFIYLKPLK